jgi:hypothetical protein
VVAHVCNRSTHKAFRQEDCKFKVNLDSKHHRWGCTSGVEHLPSMFKDLGLIPSTAKIKIKIIIVIINSLLVSSE